jgi:hypothetical protein
MPGIVAVGFTFEQKFKFARIKHHIFRLEYFKVFIGINIRAMFENSPPHSSVQGDAVKFIVKHKGLGKQLKHKQHLRPAKKYHIKFTDKKHDVGENLFNANLSGCYHTVF